MFQYGTILFVKKFKKSLVRLIRKNTLFCSKFSFSKKQLIKFIINQNILDISVHMPYAKFSFFLIQIPFCMCISKQLSYNVNSFSFLIQFDFLIKSNSKIKIRPKQKRAHYLKFSFNTKKIYLSIYLLFVYLRVTNK